MPHFHFDIFDGVQLFDTVGIDLPDVDTAKRELVRSTGEYLTDHPTRVWSGETWSIRLRDSNGKELAKLELRVAS